MKTLLLLFIKVVIAAIIIGAVMYIEQFFSGFRSDGHLHYGFYQFHSS